MPDVNPPAIFDFEQSIAAWRARLTDHQNCSASDAAELEAHLRDGIDRLRSIGLSEEEAFFVSAKRLGDPGAISLEFAKADPLRPWRTQLIWMATGFVGASLIGSTARLAADISVVLSRSMGLGIAVQGIADMLLRCLVPLAIVVMFVRSARSSDSAIASAAWAQRWWRSLTLTPARCACWIVGVLLLESASGLGVAATGYYSYLRLESRRPMMLLAMSITSWAWSFAIPVLVMILALRARKALGQAAPGR